MLKPFRFRCMFWYFFMAGFLVKTPIFIFHVWLPKAHVEAPLGGSIILAGVLLKLGGFAIIRALCAIRIYRHTPKSVIFTFLVVGGLLRSLVCITQSDLKSLVAYSSVRHINLTGAAIMADGFGRWGFSVLSIVAHGLVSPCLFALVYCTFKRVGSRRVVVCRGFLKTSPILRLFCFLFSIMNLRCPPSLGYFFEVGILSVFAKLWNEVVFWSLITNYFVGLYRIYFYTVVNHGGISRLGKPYIDKTDRRMLLCF